jgi:hypothetical protein
MFSRKSMSVSSRRVFLIYGILAVAATALITFSVMSNDLDGIRGYIMRIFFRDTTIYADRYSDKGFRDLALGSETDAVRARLGDPIESDICEDMERWRYTKSKSDSHYRYRQLSFKNGRLIKKEHYYYVD